MFLVSHEAFLGRIKKLLLISKVREDALVSRLVVDGEEEGIVVKVLLGQNALVDELGDAACSATVAGPLLVFLVGLVNDCQIMGEWLRHVLQQAR